MSDGPKFDPSFSLFSSQAHKMTEITERDPLLIRGLIFEEFGRVQAEMATNPKLWRSVTSRVHKRLSEVMGEDYVDYPEFEFWFSRFLQGNLDLDYDRRSDPKARSFTDLPLDVFNKISENLEIEDRMRLRNVCKDVRAQVDNWDLKVDEIWYNFPDEWRVRQTAISYSVFIFEQNNIPYCFHPKPVYFLMSLLKLPKIQVEKLTIHEEDEYWEKLIEELDESNRKLHVKKVQFPYPHRKSKIDLHFMIPEVIEEIKMNLLNPKRKELNEIIDSEQCQAAKMVHIESHTEFSGFPLKDLYNCPRFTLKLGRDPAIFMRANFLKKLMKKSKVQKCDLYARRKIMKYFNEPEAMVPNFPSLRRYQIPGTNDFYELEYREEFVSLERKQQ
ncbi:hypothetical protein CRE_25944 [Caenorhabditis remanei]|uniref:F-box domain-containing protein n=1 Tax=Caenorhabditis remanei TaxID=31234 RepID=E3NK16_CAERE|nr:hypothetical protein CRE_25944 [Caenorhabditis remanei]